MVVARPILVFACFFLPGRIPMSQHMTEARLRQVMQDFGPRLIALSAGICRDRHRAEEVVQEAFIRLWKSPPDAGEIAWSSWLRRVVTNLSINALHAPNVRARFPNSPTIPLSARAIAAMRIRISARTSSTFAAQWTDWMNPNARSSCFAPRSN